VCALVALVAATMLAIAGCTCPLAKKAATTPGKQPGRAVNEVVLPGPNASMTLTEGNFVMNWLVLGPFKFGEGDFGGEQQQAATDKEFMPDEAALDGTQKAPEGTACKENLFKGDAKPGQVNLDAFYGTIDHAAAYAVCWLDCPADIPDAGLCIGSDDYVKVWINGKLVHTYKEVRRASDWDQDKVAGIKLNKGLNRVVVKCVDVVLDWDFYFRLTDKNGLPMTVKAGK